VYSKQDNLLFIHIPKTGGQTILKHFLEKYNISWKNRDQLFGGKIEKDNLQLISAHLSYSQFIAYKFITREKMKQLTKFSIVRNPYDRYLSWYYMIKRKPKFLSKYTLSEHMKKTKIWFRAAKTQPKKMKHYKPYIMCKPQVTFLRYTKDIKIFKYEEYDKVKQFLKQFDIKDVLVRNITPLDVKKDYEKDLEKVIPLVNELYSDDFKTFNYKML